MGRTAKLKVQVLRSSDRGQHVPFVKARKELIERIVRGSLKHLISDELANTLSIRVEIRKTKLKGTVRGDVSFANYGRLDRQGRTEFRIRVRKGTPMLHMARVIAHECVHVAQFAEGRLGYDEDMQLTWNGKSVNLPYREQPWEIEAYNTDNEVAIAAIKSDRRALFLASMLGEF